MEIRENGSFAEIWLTIAEQNNIAIKAALPALIKSYRTEGYLPVIYRSGEKDLFEGTRDLLVHNKKLAFEREDRAKN